MSPATIARAHSMEPDMRLEDYLDDKLQSTADLENLDSLLASVEVQRSQLQTQLEDATQTLEDVRRSTHDRQGDLARRIEEFNELQRSIDVRQQIMDASDAPDEAIRRLETPMRRLQRVELAYDYVSLLQDAENMKKEARSHLPQTPKAALEPYLRLRQLSNRLRELQGPADQAAGHLVGYVEQSTQALWAKMKKIMSTEMSTVLKKRNWPQAVDPKSDMDAEWLQCFEKLMELQMLEVLYSEGVVTLLPIDVMAKPFVQWFQFQFMSDNATSSPQAFVTFCIPNFVSLIEKWEDFFRDNIGPVLASRFHGTKAGDKTVYMDPACALIASLLPIMRQKVESVVQHGLRNPQYLSNVMYHLMNLDDTIRSRFNYDGADPELGWPGLTSEVLDKHFGAWLKAEMDFALDRFHRIMESKDARQIDYDYTAPGKMKPTFGAVRVTDLLKSVTTQYARAWRLSHKVRFLIDIQLEILDQYHARLLDSLEAYVTLTSTVARTFQGVTKEQLAALEGTGTLETLCRVLGSSDHIVNTLKDWSNEEFFITLWDEIRDRVQNGDESGNVIGGMTLDQVKDRTSTKIDTDVESTIFDETIKSYSTRRESARAFLVTALNESHSTAFRPYLAKAQWTLVSVERVVDPSQLEVTAELDEPLRGNLTFLASALSTAVYRRTWREVLEELQDMLWSGLLLRQSFTTLGAAQFVRDVRAIVALVDRYIPEGSAALLPLQEGVRLLSLPVEAVDADGDGDGILLSRASDGIFTDNSEARKTLAELGIRLLEPANARKILQRRVENQ